MRGPSGILGFHGIYRDFQDSCNQIKKQYQKVRAFMRTLPEWCRKFDGTITKKEHRFAVLLRVMRNRTLKIIRTRILEPFYTDKTPLITGIHQVNLLVYYLVGRYRFLIGNRKQSWEWYWIASDWLDLFLLLLLNIFMTKVRTNVLMSCTLFLLLFFIKSIILKLLFFFLFIIKITPKGNYEWKSIFRALLFT